MLIPNRIRFCLPLLLLLAACPVRAQNAPAPADTASAPPPPVLGKWSDYAVKAYRLEIFGGSYSGGTFLDSQPIADRTVIQDGKDPLFAYNPDGSGILAPYNSMLRIEDGIILYPHLDNNAPDNRYFNAPRKEIKSGSVFGARIGIYIADAFHLDLVGSYATGTAVTSMLYDADGEAGTKFDPVRVTIEEDDGFKVYMGGLDAMYDAVPATFMGLTPHLGFGLGGIINRYTYLADKTGLYLKGNFGLSTHLRRNLDLYARAEVTEFAFEVDELGYSNMIGYTNLTLGLNWFLDVLPAPVRAAHEAELAGGH